VEEGVAFSARLNSGSSGGMEGVTPPGGFNAGLSGEMEGGAQAPAVLGVRQGLSPPKPSRQSLRSGGAG